MQFLAEIGASFNFISEYPEYLPKKKGIHQFTLKRFPFVVLYTISGQEILVLSIFNTYLNPTKKPKK